MPLAKKTGEVDVIERLDRQGQPVARTFPDDCVPLDASLGESATQSGHVHLQCSPGALRGAVSPDRVDETIRGNHSALREGQHHEHKTLLCATQGR